MVNTPPFSGLVKDDQAGSVGKNQDSKTENKGENTTKAQESASYSAMRGGDNWKHGNCLHCGKDFLKNTTWQKYCNDLCRAEAYEQRTGKKLHIAIKPKLDKA